MFIFSFLIGCCCGLIVIKYHHIAKPKSLCRIYSNCSTIYKSTVWFDQFVWAQIDRFVFTNYDLCLLDQLFWTTHRTRAFPNIKPRNSKIIFIRTLLQRVGWQLARQITSICFIDTDFTKENLCWHQLIYLDWFRGEIKTIRNRVGLFFTARQTRKILYIYTTA